MQFLDISHDEKNTYHLKKNEERVFFALNRDGEITIELTGEGATAHVFAFFTGKHAEKKNLNLIQKHLAPRTTSSALVKAVLTDQATLAYDGIIRIEKKAHQSKASQESRSLLLSKDSAAHTKPALEILADDVECRHAATVSPLNEMNLFYAKSRSLSDEAARHLFVQGFLDEAIERMADLGIERNHLRIELLKAIAQLYA